MPEPRDTNDSPACGARVDYHGGTCGKPVGHDEPDPRCVRGLPAGNCCERYDTCEPVVEPEPCRYTQPDGTRCTRPGGPRHGMCGPHYWARDDEGHAPPVDPEACSPDDYETGPELDAATLAGSMTNLDDASVHYQQGWDAGHTAGIDTGQVDERARIVAIIGPCNDEAWCADVDDCGWCRHGEFLIRQINGGPTDA